MNDQAKQAIEMCDEILDNLDDLPERAEDFADSIRERVESIKAWVEENGRVSEKQMDALDNMNSGVRKWMSD